MNRRKLPREEVSVPVKFPIAIDQRTYLKLVFDLAKNLLLQKNQIPLQFEAIVKEVEIEARLAGALEDNSEDNSDEDDEAVTREKVRERQRRVRQRRSRSQLVKNGQKLIEDFSNLENVVRSEFETGDVASISLVFGATPHSARQVFTIPTPDYITDSSSSSCSSKAGVHLFRAMMSHDTLHDVLSSRIPVSNMFILVSKRNSGSSSMISLPEFSLPSSSTCSRVSFNFSFPSPAPAESAPAATRRLRFTSGADTDQVSVTESMELCTPFTQVKQLPRVAQLSSSAVTTACNSEDMQLCTPAVRWRSQPSDLLQTDSMELCTPAVSKMNSVLCTPAPSLSQPSSMELCTPAVSVKQSSQDQYTPGVPSMELCTPAVPSMELCTPAASNNIKKRLETDCMDMCSPAIINNIKRSGDHNHQEDSLELKTPDLSNLSLLSPQKKSKVDDEDLKDSGFFSSEKSASCSEELFWFMVDQPIRGFKHRPC